MLLKYRISQQLFREAGHHLEKLEQLADPLTFTSLVGEVKKLCEQVGTPLQWLNDLLAAKAISASE